MNCFNHPDTPALGLCKSCGKGLCRECLTEIPDGLACKDRCEERAKLINKVIDSNPQTLSAARSARKNTIILYFTMGISFLFVGLLLFLFSENAGAGVFPCIFGFASIVMGVLSMKAKTKIPEV